MKSFEAKDTELAVTFPQIKAAIDRIKEDPFCLRICTRQQMDELMVQLKAELINHTFLAAPAIDGVVIVEKEIA